MKILAFAASNSKTSINKKLISYATSLLKESIIPEAEIEILDITEYELPLYRPDRELDDGIPEKARIFLQKIGTADFLIISYAEHNGSYTAAFKNLYDWASREVTKVYQGKPAVIMAASTGKRGGAGVLQTVTNVAPYFGLDIRATVSVARWRDNYDSENNTFNDPDIHKRIAEALNCIKDEYEFLT